MKTNYPTFSTKYLGSAVAGPGGVLQETIEQKTANMGEQPEPLDMNPWSKMKEQPKEGVPDFGSI